MQSRIRYTRQNVLANTFYQMPQFLFTPEFAPMSNDARVLYTLMLDRHRVSIKNNWFDENGEAFIYFRREKMQEQLNLSKNTIGKIVKELKNFALMDEKQQGLNKPNKIYLLSPSISCDTPAPWNNPDENTAADGIESGVPNIDPPESQSLGLQAPKNCASGVPNFEPQESQNLTPNHNKFNQNKMNNNELNHVMSCPIEGDGHDRPVEIETFAAKIKENIGYDDFLHCRTTDAGLLDNFVAVIVDTIFTRAATVRIGKEEKPLSVVKSVFLKLNYRDIEHAMSQFQGVTERITNKAKYIRTLHYNCKLEGDAHYTNAYSVGRFD